MSFIGSDGLEHQLKHLKAQLSSKDHEIASIRNEQKKRLDDLNDAIKAKESAEYRLQNEAEKAHTAESLLTQRTTELATLRLQHDNLQQSFTVATDKLKVGEKEKGRLQWDLDIAGSSSDSSKMLSDDNKKLQSRVKELEISLRRSEEEIRSVKSSSSGSRKLPSPTVDLFGGALSPAAPRGKSRRRSTSLSAGSDASLLERIKELEAELTALRSNEGVSSVEVDSLKSQLASVRKELDKVTNAKLALERIAKNDIEGLKSRLEDANYELEDWRREGGDGSKKEIERIKKQAHAELHQLVAKVESLQEEVKEKVRTIERLEFSAERIPELEAALEQERAATLQQASRIPLDDSDTAEQMQKTISNLEAELAQARSAPVSTSSSTSSLSLDKPTRQLQRELKTLQAQIKTMEEELQAQDEEILRLKGAVPLPGSPKMSPAPSVDLSRLLALEQDLETAQASVHVLDETIREKVSAEETRMNQIQALIEERDSLQVKLTESEEALEAAQNRTTELSESIASLKETSKADRATIEDVSALAEAARMEGEALRTRIAECDVTIQALQAALSCRTFSNEEVVQIQSTLSRSEDTVVELEVKLDQLHHDLRVSRQTQEADEAGRQAMLAEMSILREEHDTAVGSLKEQLEEAQMDVTVLRGQLENSLVNLDSKSSELEEIHERLGEVNAIKFDLEHQLSDLRETLANRSSESVANDRETALFDSREEIARLQAVLAQERSEHVNELDMATFVITKDLEDAKLKIVDLEGRLGGLQASQIVIEPVTNNAMKERRLLEDKVRRLRHERDELRISLNFVNHEHQFARQAAMAERAIARDNLSRAQGDLDEQTTLLSSVQAEFDTAKERLSSISSGLLNGPHDPEQSDLVDKLEHLERYLAAVSASKEEQVTKVAELENKLQESEIEHRAQAEMSGDLVSEIAHIRIRAEKAESDLNVMRKRHQAMESEFQRLQARLEDQPSTPSLSSSADILEGLEIQWDRQASTASATEKQNRRSSIIYGSSRAQASSTPNQVSERPASVHGHVRRRSGLPAPLEPIDNLRIEKAELMGKLQRRDARIKALENEIKQAKANLQLAEEAAGENATEQEDAVRELRDQEQITLKAEVNLQIVVLALAVHHKSIVESRREWYARTKMLRQSDATVDRIRETAIQALQGAASRLDGLTATVTTLRAEQLAAIGEHGRLSKINERLGSELGEARTELSDRTTALEQTLQDLSSAEASVEALKSELSEARLQVEQITTSTSERIAGLESELDTVQAHQSSLESEVADLLAKLSIAEKARNELRESQSTQDSTIALELQAAQVRVKELDSELETLLESLAALEGERDDLARTNDDKQSLVHKHLATIDETQSMVARLEMTLREKEDTISVLTSELAESRGSMAELESTLQQKGDALRDLHQEAMSAGQARITALESDLAGKAAQVEALQLQVERSSEEAAIQKAKVDELNKANDARISDAQMLHDFSQLESSLRSELSMVQSQLQDTQNRLTEVQAQLHASETTAKEAQDTLASLQVENEEMKSRLGQATENASSAPATESEVLLERITELEASLTLKVQEVDEADDRVREAFKSKVKLEKKVGKLQRQLAAATAADSETASNTAANKTLSLAALEMPPPPVPVSITAPIVSATIAATRATPSGVQSTPFFTPRSAPLPSPSTRQPLRPVNVFDPKPSPSSAGLKRQREGDEKQLPAEMILLPPANVDTATKRPVKLGFTPSRSLNALNMRGTAGDQNVPVSERRSTSMSRNIFSDQ